VAWHEPQPHDAIELGLQEHEPGLLGNLRKNLQQEGREEEEGGNEPRFLNDSQKKPAPGKGGRGEEGGTWHGMNPIRPLPRPETGPNVCDKLALDEQ